MSANRWSICPQCKSDRIAAVAKLRADARAMYGKATAEEYAKAIREADEIEIENMEEDLREDWELGLRDGVFRVGYRAECQCCGWLFVFDEERKIELEAKS